MTPVTTLWLPILLSAIACFVVSSIIHMASPWHKSDYATLPDEDAVLNALRPFAIPPDDYMAPRPRSMGDLKSAEFAERRSQGPVLIMTVIPNGPLSMGGSLGGWFVYLLLVALIAGALAASALPPGADMHAVFHHVGIAAALGFVGALWQMSIWYKRKVSTSIKSSIDGLIYAAITATIFAWLWPTG